VSSTGISSLIRLILIFLPFIFIQHLFHRELQYSLLLFTRRKQVFVRLFAVLFFPGVLVHEGSHFLMSKILGVRTGRFSISPTATSDGHIRMGYVEAERVDVFRNTLIGAAPLIAGGIAISLISRYLLHASFLFDQNTLLTDQFFPWLWEGFSNPWFWVGLYLAVTISGMMVPSASDRRDWLIFLLILAGLVLLFYFVGALAWLQQVVTPWLLRLMNALALVFGVGLMVQTIVLIPLWLLRKLAQWMR
jgi:hypothetical protein